MGDPSSTLEHEINSMMRHMLTAMATHGVNPTDILYVNLHVTDMSLFSRINQIYCQYFSYNPPSRACVEISNNLPCGARCMADCMGYVGSGTAVGDGRVDVPRDVLHVQSISEWAPTCIGPYSQANMLSGIHYQAGQIGLDPASMVLVTGGWENETRQTLSNISAVLKCCQSSFQNLLSCVVWVNVSKPVDVAGVRKMIENRVNNENVHRNPAHRNAFMKEMIAIVPVPNLPRGAAVELQVVAMEHNVLNAIRGVSFAAVQKWVVGDVVGGVVGGVAGKKTKNAVGGTLEAHGIHITDLVCVGHVRYTYETVGGVEGVEDVEVVRGLVQTGVEQMLLVLHDVIVRQSNMQWSLVNQLQIYCCGTSYLHAHVRAIFAESWAAMVEGKGTLAPPPALSFVPVRGQEHDHQFIQMCVKTFDVDKLAPLSKIQSSSSSTSVSTLSISSMDVHVAEEDGGTSTENEAFKESHGGFAAAMKAVEEADGGEVASDCSDMSDMSDCDVFESLNIVPVGGIGSSESESEEEEEEEGGG